MMNAQELQETLRRMNDGEILFTVWKTSVNDPDCVEASVIMKRSKGLSLMRLSVVKNEVLRERGFDYLHWEMHRLLDETIATNDMLVISDLFRG